MTEQPQGVLPRAKLSAVSLLTTLANNIQANIPYPRRQPDIVFPPPSWNVEELEKRESNVDAEDNKKEEEPAKPVNEEPTTAPVPPAPTDKPEDPPEVTTFAQKLRDLIESLPVPPAVTATMTNAIDSASGSTRSKTGPATKDQSHEVEIPPVDGEGPPVPDGVDPETLKFLSSQSVMTGTANGAATPSTAQSVWAALERLKPASWTKTTTDDKGKQPEEPPVDSGEGVMMYAPLQPDNSSEVELAECILPGGEKERGAEQSTSPPPIARSPPTDAQPKIWVPSTTSISIYTTWWGYRIYLPPPIIAQLSSSQVNVTKRASIITAFLQWLLTRIPNMIAPPQFRGALIMLKRLAPVIGYVGVFIAWSWKRITEADEGNGVVLSATWVLPVALIPGKWDAGDIYGPKEKPIEEIPLEEPPKVEEKKKTGFVDKLNPFSWGKK